MHDVSTRVAKEEGSRSHLSFVDDGVLEFENGDIYIGEIKENVMHGMGIYR